MQTFLNNYYNRKGLHFYINIKNFDSLVATDEKDGDMSHMFHFLNTFLTSLERYIRDNFNTDKVIIEKLTGSRLHIVVYGECTGAFGYFLNITSFAFKLAKYVISLPKYKTFSKVSLQVGADYGTFHDFVFKDNDFEEYTSIGYPANFACKLQSLANEGEIIISKRIYDNIPSLNSTFISKLDSTRQSYIYQKYPGVGNTAYSVSSALRNSFYENLNKHLLFESIDNKSRNYDKYFELANRIANKTDFKDMDTIEPYKMNFENWNIKQSARTNAAVVFADVRGFTKMFDSNGSNLSLMSSITQNILSSMYGKCSECHGVHVQFQGDREFVFFPEREILNSVIFGLKLKHAISLIGNGIEIGVGINFGKVYATQIGLDSEDDNFVKQNILIGNTIKEADKLEDSCALAGEITISNEVYNHRLMNKEAKSLFGRRSYYWVTNKSFNEYVEKTRKSEYERSASQNTYKPWNKN